jgi:hypothetical protein
MLTAGSVYCTTGKRHVATWPSYVLLVIHFIIIINIIIIVIIIIIIINLCTAAFKAYCAIWVRSSNCRHQASPRVLPRESTQRPEVELWAKNVREFCLNSDLHVTFRDLSHAVNLRHRTDGFTSPLKEGALRIFSP